MMSFCYLRGIGRGTTSFLRESFEGKGFGFELDILGQRISALRMANGKKCMKEVIRGYSGGCQGN
jgi:hypothetical protein